MAPSQTSTTLGLSLRPAAQLAARVPGETETRLRERDEATGDDVGREKVKGARRFPVDPGLDRRPICSDARLVVDAHRVRVQLEVALVAFASRHDAVQDETRVAEQIGGLR